MKYSLLSLSNRLVYSLVVILPALLNLNYSIGNSIVVKKDGRDSE